VLDLRLSSDPAHGSSVDRSFHDAEYYFTAFVFLDREENVEESRKIGNNKERERGDGKYPCPISIQRTKEALQHLF
jgi:hypothetical protein